MLSPSSSSETGHHTRAVEGSGGGGDLGGSGSGHSTLSPSLSGGTTSHHSGGIEGGGGGGRWRRHGLGRNGGCGKQDVGCW